MVKRSRYMVTDYGRIYGRKMNNNGGHEVVQEVQMLYHQQAADLKVDRALEDEVKSARVVRIELDGQIRWTLINLYIQTVHGHHTCLIPHAGLRLVESDIIRRRKNHQVVIGTRIVVIVTEKVKLLLPLHRLLHGVEEKNLYHEYHVVGPSQLDGVLLM